MIDALSLYEAGARNVVSVPSGCSNLDWIDHCWNWLERFQTIILFGDNDEPGRKMIREVVRRLDESRCMIVEDSALGIQAAKAAGAKVIALRDRDGAIDQRQADAIVTQVSDILHYL